MRDHTKLRAFELADALVISVYQATRCFPHDEQFGLTGQMRRAAISIPSNIVEGSARSSQKDYIHFLTVAYASACELQYQLSIAQRLDYCTPECFTTLNSQCDETGRVLNGLIRALRKN